MMLMKQSSHVFHEEGQTIEQDGRLGEVSQQQTQLEKGLQLLALALETLQIAIKLRIVQLQV